MKCKWHGVNHHRTRDQASPGAIETLKVAAFPPKFSAACECSQGKVSAENCSGFSLFEEDGKPVAHFAGSKYRVGQGESGEVVVYSAPNAPSTESTPTQDSTPCRDFMAHSRKLTEWNAKNSSFWERLNREG
jgi:hypothetical protein